MAQIGTVKLQTQNSGVVDVPVFETGDSGSSTYEFVRVQTGSGTGFIPVTNTNDAAYPYLRVQSQNNGVVAVTDSTSVIPDSQDLHARYDARELSLSDGQSISSWADETGNGHELSSVDSSPTFKENQVDGVDAVRFDDDDLRTTWSDLSESFQIFALGQLHGKSGSGNDDTIFDGANREEHRFAIRPADAGDPWRLVQGSDVNGSNSDLEPHIWNTLWQQSGSNDILKIDGSQDISRDLGDSASSGLTLGGRYNSGSIDEQSQVDIVEILVYKKDKTSVEDDIEAYLDRDTNIL